MPELYDFEKNIEYIGGRRVVYADNGKKIENAYSIMTQSSKDPQNKVFKVSYIDSALNSLANSRSLSLDDRRKVSYLNKINNAEVTVTLDMSELLKKTGTNFTHFTGCKIYRHRADGVYTGTEMPSTVNQVVHQNIDYSNVVNHSTAKVFISEANKSSFFINTGNLNKLDINCQVGGNICTTNPDSQTHLKVMFTPGSRNAANTYIDVHSPNLEVSNPYFQSHVSLIVNNRCFNSKTTIKTNTITNGKITTMGSLEITPYHLDINKKIKEYDYKARTLKTCYNNVDIHCYDFKASIGRFEGNVHAYSVNLTAKSFSGKINSSQIKINVDTFKGNMKVDKADLTFNKSWSGKICSKQKLDKLAQFSKGQENGYYIYSK